MTSSTAVDLYVLRNRADIRPDRKASFATFFSDTPDPGLPELNGTFTFLPGTEVDVEVDGPHSWSVKRYRKLMALKEQESPESWR